MAIPRKLVVQIVVKPYGAQWKCYIVEFVAWLLGIHATFDCEVKK